MHAAGHGVRLAWLAAGAVWSSVCVAQVDERGLRRDPDQGPQPLREEDQPAPVLELALPPVEPAPESGALSSMLDRVRVERVELEGNSVLPMSDVRRILDPLGGRDISADELQSARLALIQLYVDRGYISSGVQIPDQDVSSGTIRLLAIEGRLATIELRGERPRFAVESVLRPLRSLRGAPLNLVQLQRALTAIDDDPLVQAIKAELQPTATTGEASLTVEIVPASPGWAGVRADNHRAPSVGGEEAVVEVGHRSLLGLSDALELSYAVTEGLDDFGVDYLFPIGARGWSLGASWSRNDAVVIEEPFDRIDIESGSDRGRLSLTRVLGNGIDRFGTLALFLDNESSETTLLGVPFSFAPGVVDGKAEVSALRAMGEWGWRERNDAFVARAILSFGIDAFGATVNSGLPDTRFVALFAQAQYARLLSDARGDQIVLRAEVQFANQALLPLEKYQLGGAFTVRGYRHNQVVRDSGYALSAEYRYPLDDGAIAAWGMTLAVFADVGRGWNEDGHGPSPQSIESVGIGLRWDPNPRWHGELYLAAPFTDFETAQHDLQDSGVHFQLAFRWP